MTKRKTSTSRVIASFNKQNSLRSSCLYLESIATLNYLRGATPDSDTAIVPSHRSVRSLSLPSYPPIHMQHTMTDVSHEAMKAEIDGFPCKLFS